jgi:hypothetical protein
MRANGTFKKYQEKIIEKNILAQLKDEREKVTDIYNQLTFAIEYVRNDKGELEK